jgi:glycerol-3-phosphate acyltransferase PlsX
LSARITIALDAMGGDQAPRMVLKGADKSLKRYPQAHFLLFGDEAKIAPLLAKMPRLAARAQVQHTNEFITNEAKPSIALRTGRRSSMRLAIDAVADGRADGIVSAGNTGALMAMAKFALKMLPGIDRPAIASFFPTQRGESVMLDLGANIECDADNLVQFALMGDAFARSVLGLTQPTIGLLNVGSEDLKGHDAVRGAASQLRAESSPVKFYGFIEGNDIAAGTVDVIVTDGFTGNVALKTAEGTARLSVRCRCLEEDARANGSAALQWRHVARSQRDRGQEPWRRRRARVCQCHRRRGRHEAEWLRRSDSRRARPFEGHPGPAGNAAIGGTLS